MTLIDYKVTNSLLFQQNSVTGNSFIEPMLIMKEFRIIIC